MPYARNKVNPKASLELVDINKWVNLRARPADVFEDLKAKK